jgi:glyceraldehyde-3-phosphate dehydrogenase/erythrose-4-phosphate dehydrogenase
MTNVAINGLGRIGRATLKIVMETPDLNLVAANDIGAADSVEYLLKYDTVYGRYEKPVQATGDGQLKIGDHHLQLLREKDPARLPWKLLSATATARALPEYRGRFDGVAVRAPVPVGSLADIVSLVARTTTVDEVNRAFVEEAESERYRGVLGVTIDPIVSSDIIKDSRASIVDLGMTQVVDGDLVKVMSWYDNEWGYSSQLVREAVRIAREIDHRTVERGASGADSEETMKTD